MRLFLAIDCGNRIRASMVLLQAGMAEIAPYTFRMAAPEKMHATLKFLGDCSDEEVADLIDLLSTEPCPVKEPFRLTTGKPGLFPSSHKVKVVWCGIHAGNGTLKALNSHCEELAQAVGFPPENKDYRPHITLARCKKHPGNHFSTALHAIPFPAAEQSVSAFVLKASIGDTYRTLATFPLENSGSRNTNKA